MLDVGSTASFRLAPNFARNCSLIDSAMTLQQVLLWVHQSVCFKGSGNIVRLVGIPRSHATIAFLLLWKWVIWSEALSWGRGYTSVSVTCSCDWLVSTGPAKNRSCMCHFTTWWSTSQVWFYGFVDRVPPSSWRAAHFWSFAVSQVGSPSLWGHMLKVFSEKPEQLAAWSGHGLATTPWILCYDPLGEYQRLYLLSLFISVLQVALYLLGHMI